MGAVKTFPRMTLTQDVVRLSATPPLQKHFLLSLIPRLDQEDHHKMILTPTPKCLTYCLKIFGIQPTRR